MAGKAPASGPVTCLSYRAFGEFLDAFLEMTGGKRGRLNLMNGISESYVFGGEGFFLCQGGSEWDLFYRIRHDLRPRIYFLEETVSKFPLWVGALNLKEAVSEPVRGEYWPAQPWP